MSTTDNNNEQQCDDSGEMTLNKEKCTCEQNGVDSITEGINSVTLLDDKSICANCGKEGNDVNNVCNKCKMVKYCNAACKKRHRHKHKKDCDEHLRQAAKLHDIELFKEPPPAEDCPICFLWLPALSSGRKYKKCCGKRICSGCAYAPVFDNQGNEVDNQKCPFCRTPKPASAAEALERLKKRVMTGDPVAMFNLGCDYREAARGLPQDYGKALELWHRAGELGHASAYYNIGAFYNNGEGVEVDEKKAIHYNELAAMMGDADARYNLGLNEDDADNIDRALKHYMIAAKGGSRQSLGQIRELYSDGHAAKEDYTKALQLYQTFLGEIKSEQRDKAAAAREDCRYYY